MATIDAPTAPRRLSTLERAYELAKSGKCAGLNDIKVRLEVEQYDDIRGQLFGPTLKLELQRLCNAAREVAPGHAPEKPKARAGKKRPSKAAPLP